MTPYEREKNQSQVMTACKLNQCVILGTYVAPMLTPTPYVTYMLLTCKSLPSPLEVILWHKLLRPQTRPKLGKNTSATEC